LKEGFFFKKNYTKEKLVDLEVMKKQKANTGMKCNIDEIKQYYGENNRFIEVIHYQIYCFNKYLSLILHANFN
jgi:hypothetical protein